MPSRLLFNLLQLRERLWLRPLLYCLFAIAIVFLARAADFVDHGLQIPMVSVETIEKLLTIVSTTMLAVATFAVASMVSAYSSAAATATPRAFALLVSDDVSQAALSSFIGAFIFAIVGIIAVKTGLYEVTGQFVLFSMTVLVFGWVIVTFVRWVDNIARLGRVGNTIDKAEQAATRMIEARSAAPFMAGRPADPDSPLTGTELCPGSIGYVCFLDMERLQKFAETHDVAIEILTLPGAFMGPARAFCRVAGVSELSGDQQMELREAVVIGHNRTFEADPRFALVVLAEIAARALSPSVNDPGTAITILGAMVRLFTRWADRLKVEDSAEIRFDRIYVPALSTSDMFDDAFTAIARDGAAFVEVGIRLQSAFRSLSDLDDPEIEQHAKRHAVLALRRFREGLSL